MVGRQPGSGSITYLALGDSLTAGVGASDYRYSYPYLIAQRLSKKNNVRFVNLANPGDTSTDVLNDQAPKVLSLKPDLITLLVGVNDIHNLVSLQEFEQNYIKIVSTLKKTRSKIYLLSIPYLGSDKTVFFPYNFILDFRTKQFNRVIEKISQDYNLYYIDLYHLNKSKNFYSADKFHPSDQGYKDWLRVLNVN